MSHKHSVYDTNPHFTIDPATRAIKNESGKVVIIQHDHKSERFTFDIPKEVDGHNMSLCNKVRIHYINIDSSTKEVSKDIYDVADLGVSPSSDDVVIFSWLLDGNATLYKGSLNFSIRFECVQDDGTVDYSWGTAAHSGIIIGEDVYNSEYIIKEHSDILAKWEAEIFGAGDSVMADIATAGDVQKDAIAAKGEAVLATIPEDYTVTHLMADTALRTKASAIVVEAEGETIVSDDCSNDHLQGLKVYGKTTQDGTPTLEAPVELVSIENPTVEIHSKNLLALPQVIEKPITSYNYDLYTGTAGQSTPVSAENMARLPYVIVGRSYYFSCEVPEFALPAGIKVVAVNDDGTIGDASDSASAILLVNSGTFVPTKSTHITIRVGATDALTIRNIQLELGSSATEYEFGAEKQSASVPHTLHGIPVTSGGNYADENGQQWIADYVDFERGVYVQNVDSYALDGRSKLVVKNDEKSGSYLYYHKQDKTNKPVGGYCTHFAHVDRYPEQVAGTFNATKSHAILMSGIGIVSEDNTALNGQTEFNDWLYAQYEAGTPVTIAYALATPIETPLTDEELYAFSQMHSNYPTTTVLNDSGAYMSVDYVADTKTYVDNKIAELVASITGNS